MPPPLPSSSTDCHSSAGSLPQIQWGVCWPRSPRAAKHWQPECSHGVSIDAGCQLRLPCLSVPRCLPGGRWWDGNSPNRLFLLQFQIPNTSGCVAMTNSMGLIFWSSLLHAARVMVLVLCPSAVLWTTPCNTQPLLLWQGWTTGSWKGYPVLAEPDGRRCVGQTCSRLRQGSSCFGRCLPGVVKRPWHCHLYGWDEALGKPGLPWGCTGGAQGQR